MRNENINTHTYINKQTNIYCWLIWTNKSINTTPTNRIFIYSHSHASGLFVVLIAHCASRYLLISPVCKSNIKSHTNNGIGNKQFSFMWMRFNSIRYVNNNNNNNQNKFHFVPFECRNFMPSRKKIMGRNKYIFYFVGLALNQRDFCIWFVAQLWLYHHLI